MLDASTVETTIFEKLRDPNYPHGELVTMVFNGVTAAKKGLKSTSVKTVQVTEMGEVVGDTFTVRLLVSDFATPPAEKDMITLDGTEYQIAETRYSGYGAILRLFILDGDM